MDTSRPHVLVTDSASGQNRAALAAVRALAAAGYAPVVATSSPYSLAASSRACERRVAVPPVDDPGFAAVIRAELGRGDYLTVFATSDGALLQLGGADSELLDKAELGRRAAAAGFPRLPECRFETPEELRAARDELDYPIVVKPLVKRAGSERPAFRADGPGDLEPLEASGPVLVQSWADEPMRAIAGVTDGMQFVAIVHQRYVRTWPRECGTASAAVTTPPFFEDEERLLSVLGGHRGVFQAQLIGAHLVDLNARVYGSLPLAVAAGANLPAIACKLAAGGEPELVRGRPGVAYRWLEGDLRHVWGAVRSGSLGAADALRALRPRRGSAHSVESLRDPQPLLNRLSYAVRRR